MRSFYLSGPMRGYDHLNFPAFDRAAEQGRALGFRVISPADEDRKLGLDASNWSNTPDQIRESVDRDTKALLSLRSEKGDGIALLPGWEKSTGAVAEFILARWLGLCVVDARTWRPFTEDALAELSLRPVEFAIMEYLGTATF